MIPRKNILQKYPLCDKVKFEQHVPWLIEAGRARVQCMPRAESVPLYTCRGRKKDSIQDRRFSSPEAGIKGEDEKAEVTYGTGYVSLLWRNESLSG